MHVTESQRMTRQRKLILDALRGRTDHPSADMIYDAVRKTMPKISLGTVYRNLELLHRTGLIEKIDAGSGQARYDGNPRTHYHAVCTECGMVRDVDDEAVRAFEFDPGRIDRFEVSGHIIHFTGICDTCRTGASDRTTSSSSTSPGKMH